MGELRNRPPAHIPTKSVQYAIACHISFCIYIESTCVDRPIEIVEYQRHTCICGKCGEKQVADWSPEMVPGQDMGVRLQGFLGLIKLPDLNNEEIGREFINLIDEGSEHHALFRQTQNLDEFLSWACGFKLKVESAIDSWFDRGGGEAGKLLRSLRKKAQQWWYFLDHPDIPPDNNLAERTLRLAVTKRKVSGSSRSMERFQDTGNLLTVIQTCRRQKRSVIEFFDQAIKAMVNPAVQIPSLIPPVQT